MTAQAQKPSNAIAEAGTPGFTLMMRAAQVSLEHIGPEKSREKGFTRGMVVLAGPGNMAGGYGLAALASLAGYSVTVIAYGMPQNDAQLARVFAKI